MLFYFFPANFFIGNQLFYKKITPITFKVIDVILMFIEQL